MYEDKDITDKEIQCDESGCSIYDCEVCLFFQGKHIRG